MKIIGLTGPSGTGKSTVALLAENLGYSVIDCDKVAASVTDDPALLAKLEAEFGGVTEKGRLNRKALADKAFASKEKTDKLNGIMLPVVVDAIDKKIKSLKDSGCKAVLLDAPTLYESGADNICNDVIAVLANEKIRRERILKRDGLTEAQLEKRLNAAKPDSFYLERAGHIIYNNGDLESFKESAAEIFKKINQ